MCRKNLLLAVQYIESALQGNISKKRLEFMSHCLDFVIVGFQGGFLSSVATTSCLGTLGYRVLHGSHLPVH